MDMTKLIPFAVAAGLVFGTKFVHNDKAKAAMLGAAGVVVLRQVPYLNQYV